MSRRLISRVNGFVHDIEKVISLSDVPNNARLLSDRSLYILQNLSGEEITFLSRYGEIETGGYYLPVEAGSDGASGVYDAVSIIRKDLNSMALEDSLACICEQLQAIAASISAAQTGGCECTIGSDVETTSGSEGGDLPDPVNGVAYEEPSEITSRKCKASNYIHGAIAEVVNELKLSRADSYGFAGLAFVLSLVATIVGGLIAGPFGLLLGAVVGSFLSMATMLFKGSFSLTILLAAIEADEQAAICALFGATTASGARSSYLAHLSSEGATSVEIEFIEQLLTNNLMNLLFFGWGDSEEAIENADIIHECTVCSGASIVWEFEASAEGWTYEDESDGNSSAEMTWEESTEALRDTLDVVAGPGVRSQIRDKSPAIVFTSDGNQRVSVTFGAPEGAKVTSIGCAVQFETEPEEAHWWSSTSTGGLRTHDISTEDIITRIDVMKGRGNDGTFEYFIDVEDVTLETL